jgi:polyribonucleotide 5'-hydroxyl-kinase
VDRDANYMKEVRHDSVKRYFYGEPKRPLSPYTMTVDFDQLHIYKLPEQDSLNLSFMPVGYEGDLNKPILEKQAITPLLTNALAAILHANLNDSVDDMVISTVMGFVYMWVFPKDRLLIYNLTSD